MRSIFPALLTILFCFSASAQSIDRPHSLERGAWALHYQVDGIRLTFYQGMFAVKYHFADDRALRFGLGGNAATAGGGDHFRGGVSGQVHYLRYIRPEREVKFYVGAGPFVGYGRQSDDYGSSYLRIDRLTMGAGGKLGAEWFATRSISFLAEYGNLLAVMFWSEDRRTPPKHSGRDYSYGNSVTVGLTLYL
jgi:hypothetical protein